MERIKGYIVGHDERSKGLIPVVKVTEGELMGTKYDVASVHDNIALADGIDVTFLLGKRGRHGNMVAVDVRLENYKG